MGALTKEGSQLRVRQRRAAAAGFYTKREKVLGGILPSCGSLECSAPRKDNSTQRGEGTDGKKDFKNS